MKFRFGIFAIYIGFILSLSTSRPARGQDDGQPRGAASIQVLVRDGRGAPVSGLTADAFVVTEEGVEDRVYSVQGLTPDTPTHPEINRLSSGSTLPSTPAKTGTASPTNSTSVLVILAPTSAPGRNYTIKSIQHFLSRPEALSLRIGLVDDEGTYVPIGQSVEQLRTIFEHLAKRVSTPQRGGQWIRKAYRGIAELGILPGRHAILFASDFDWDVSDPDSRDPRLLRIGPSTFISAAVQAQAAMYTVQSSGLETVVPMGSAAGGQYSGSGQEIATRLMDETSSLGALRSDYLYAANETGGMSAFDPQDAFARIAADAVGYYRISFRPSDEADGAWHPVSVSVRDSRLHVKGPRFYAAPIDAGREQIPPAIKAALNRGAGVYGLQMGAHAWLFPVSRGVHTGVLAADIGWPGKDNVPGNSSRLQVFAQLIDDTRGRTVGTWLVEKDWRTDQNLAPTVHWQREVTLYPGSYTLKVIGMDIVSGRIGTSAHSFLAHPTEERALRLSAIVLADNCISESEQTGSRHNLFDPMLSQGCMLAPAASVTFKPNQNPIVFLRLYPPSQRFEKLISKDWKAVAMIDGATSNERAFPLEITHAEIRGFEVSGKVMLSDMQLKPGPHQLTVEFEIRADKGPPRRIPLNAEFFIEALPANDGLAH